MYKITTVVPVTSLTFAAKANTEKDIKIPQIVNDTNSSWLHEMMHFSSSRHVNQ